MASQPWRTVPVGATLLTGEVVTGRPNASAAILDNRRALFLPPDTPVEVVESAPTEALAAIFTAFPQTTFLEG